MTAHKKVLRFIPYIIALVVISAAAGGYSVYKLYQENTQLKTTLSEREQDLTLTQERLSEIQKGNAELLLSLQAEAEKSNSFSEHLTVVTEDFKKLQWLSTLDKQLLQKYSKIYFLNENYTPRSTSTIDTKYLFNKNKPLEIHEYVLPFLKDMLRDAEKDDITISVASAYRSFKEQAALKSNYKVQYGYGANAFSAEQGYSEHQLGTTVDLTTTAIGGALTGFEKTTAYTWLKKHAHEYGFVLSYPQGNSYYIFEPWHWRFIGIDLATQLHEDEKYFYALDQREIDAYLGAMFNEEASTSSQ